MGRLGVDTGSQGTRGGGVCHHCCHMPQLRRLLGAAGSAGMLACGRRVAIRPRWSGCLAQVSLPHSAPAARRACLYRFQSPPICGLHHGHTTKNRTIAIRTLPSAHTPATLTCQLSLLPQALPWALPAVTAAALRQLPPHALRHNCSTMPRPVRKIPQIAKSVKSRATHSAPQPSNTPPRILVT